jgi:hypothetical protein
VALFSTLIDDFQTGTVSTSIWPFQAGVTVQGGQAKFTGAGRAYIQSAPTYAIASSQVWMRIITAPREWATGSYMQFGVYKDDYNFYAVRIYGPGNADYGPGSGEIRSATGGVISTTFCYYSSDDGGVATYELWNAIAHNGTRFTHLGANNPATSSSAFEQPPNPGWNPTATMYLRFETVGIGTAVCWLDNINTNLALGPNAAVLPGSTINAGSYGQPTITQPILKPGSVGDLGSIGEPAVLQPHVLLPSTTVDQQTIGGAQTGQPNSPYPAGVTDTSTVGAARVDSSTIGPAGITDTGKVGQAAVSSTRSGLYGDDLYGTGFYGGNPNQINPIGVGDPDAVAAEVQGTGGPVTPPVSGYGGGLYSTGVYSGSGANPNEVGPAGVRDVEFIHGQDTDGYGTGPYGGGAYQSRNVGETIAGYGSGLYGAGLYQGGTTPGGAAYDPVLPVIRVVANPLHILGIGPWNPVKVWHGAANYGIGAGRMPARPQMQLPGVQSKQVTLRLTGGDEATVTCQHDAGSAVVVREMATDLWWLRRDPRTGQVDMLGRFNCSHNDLSRSTDGLIASSLQFQDWKIVLGNRMVLKYKDTANAESQWPKSVTPVTEIMRFAVPTDMGIDLSALDDDALLGNITQPFSLPPYNTIDQTFEALLAVSPKPWEWWVQAGTNYGPPVLKFAAQRGRDSGVTLYDGGHGPTPIASWQMRATSDNYANTLYFQGGTASTTVQPGGVIRQITAEVADVGQRDAQTSDNSVLDTVDPVTGKPAALIAAADKALAPMADRRPTFTVVLAANFWRGRTHIDVGDTVRLRIRLGKELLAYSYRVTEIGIDIDGAGTETVTLTLGNPLASANPRSKYSPVFRLVRTLRNYTPPTGSLA